MHSFCIKSLFKVSKIWEKNTNLSVINKHTLLVQLLHTNLIVAIALNLCDFGSFMSSLETLN